MKQLLQEDDYDALSKYCKIRKRNIDTFIEPELNNLLKSEIFKQLKKNSNKDKTMFYDTLFKNEALKDTNCSLYINKNYKHLDNYSLPKNPSEKDIQDYLKWSEQTKEKRGEAFTNNIKITYCWQQKYFENLIIAGNLLRDKNISWSAKLGAK